MSRLLAGFLTFLLWLLTVALGILEVVIGVRITLSSYTGILRFFGVITEDYGREYWVGYNIQTLSALILGVGVAAMAIISGEIYFRHFGTRRAWKLGAWILGVEIGLLMIGYFVSADAYYLIDLLPGFGGQ